MKSTWEQRPEGWLDTISGLLWLPIEFEKYTYETAMKLFNTPNKRLPTKEEWEVAELHGIREVFNDIEYNYFWSSSSYPYGGGFAWVFVGGDGYVGFGFRRGDDYYCVCCVRDTRVLEFNNTLKELME